MSLLIVLGALIFLMFVAYRGYSVILFAPIAALGAVLLTDPSLVPPLFSSVFMEKMVGFVKNYFPVFMLGAVFGKVIELSGFSKSIVAAVIGVLGRERAVPSIVLRCCFAIAPTTASLSRMIRSPVMSQHASKNVPPSVGADVAGIETLLNRNLLEVFGEGDPARRRAAIRELYTEDCVLYVPPGAFVGHDALDKFAGDLRATHPHFVYMPHGAPQVLHNSGRLAWGSGPKGEAPV
jgi:hypothetical protein